jgi:hypothetical protein
MTATTSPIDLLREACATGDLPSNASLSDDGKFLTIFGSTFDATTPQAMALGGDGDRVVNYTLASVYLQLINPALLRYHKACGSAGVRDPVKTLDRDHVISHFRLGNKNASAAAPGGSSGGVDDVDGAAAGAGAARGKEEEDDDMDVASDDEDVVAAAVARPSRAPKDGRRSTRDRDDDGGSSGKRRRVGGSSSSKKSSRLEKSSRGSREEDGRSSRRSSGEGGVGKAKAPSVPITNEQLVANLGKIVDKRHTVPTTPEREGGDGYGAASAANSNADANVAADAESAPVTPAPTTIAPDDDGPERTAEGGGLDRELLLAWLSPDGFRVDSPTVASAIEADREAVRRITASEIPVGDSASVLRAGAGGEVFGGVSAGGEMTTTTVPSPAGGVAATGGGGGVKKRDFARVLEIYQEVAATEERARRLAVASSSSKGGKGRPLPPPPPSNNGKASSSTATAAAAGGTSTTMSVAGNPIIVVPNAMTSVITMINAGIFLGKEGVYLSREQAMSDPGAGKRGGTVTITRKLAPRLGGSEITYEIIDNPATRLKKDEWNRVVAVICQGASWQFKGWRYSDPVDLFSRTFGFYVGLDGAAVPNELQGWNVKIGRVSRDRRGLDNVCLASFWNGLEEFMAVHKQDFIHS